MPEPSTAEVAGSPVGVPRFGSRALTGAAWLTLATVINGMVGAVVGVFLARTLGPESIGQYTLALATSDLFALLVGWGVEIYIVQAPSMQAKRFGTALSLSILLSVAFFLLSCGLSAYFLIGQHNRLVANFLPVLAIQRACFLVGWCYAAMLQRTFRFGILAIIQVVSGMVVHIVAVVVALAGGGPWALMLRDLLDALISLVGAVLVSGVPFRLAWDRGVWRELWTFGRAVLVGQGGELASNRLDNMALGFTWGATPLGYYAEAFKLADVVRRASRPALSQVALTAYARLRADPARLRSVFYRVQARGWLALAPAAAMLAFVPDAAISVLFGPKWLPAVPIARALAVYVAVIPLFDHVVQLLQSQGNPAAVARAKVAQLAAFAVALAVLLPRFGGPGTALAVDAGVVAGFIVAFHAAVPYIGAMGDVVRSYGYALAAACGAGVVCIWPAADLPPLWRLILLWAVYLVLAAPLHCTALLELVTLIRHHRLPSLPRVDPAASP